MPEKDPSTYPLLTYVWVIGLSAWGGLVGYIRKVREGAGVPFSLAALIGEILTSAFVGVITFWLCEQSGLSPLLTAAFVGISGHMGSRAIFQMDNLLTHWFEKVFGK